MFLRAFREGCEVIATRRRSISQRVDLKTTALDLRHNFRFPSQTANYFDVLAGNDKRNQLVVDRGVLEEHALGTQRRLQPANREQIVSCLICADATMLKLAHTFQHLVLAFEQFAFEFGVGLLNLNRARSEE